jgi:hypothetical protein
MSPLIPNNDNSSSRTGYVSQNLSHRFFKQKLTLILLITAVILFTAARPAEASGDGVVTYYAVICGIEDYPGDGADLNYCHEDADDVNDALFYWDNWNSTTLLKGSVTKNQIHTAIQNKCAAADEDDICVFYFSGHGWSYPGYDVYPEDEADGMDEYLVPYDGIDEYYIYPENCIRDDELGDWMDDFPGTYVVFIDACFSGGQIKGITTKVKSIGNATPQKGDGFAADLTARVKTKDLNDNGRGVVLTCGDDDEECIECSCFYNGVFTYYLTQGMVGPADDNGNDRISGEECYWYTEPRAADHAWYTHGCIQNAQIYDGHPGQLEFLHDLDECSITVTSPTSSSNWETGISHTINWTSSNNPSDYVKIQLYKGDSLIQTITSITYDDGSYSWIPSTLPDGCDYSIKITSYTDSSCYDYSDDYCIYTPCTCSITVTSPTNSSSWGCGGCYDATWSSDCNPSNYVSIDLYKSGSLEQTIALSTSDDGSYNWCVPEVITDCDYRIKITSTTDSSCYDYSDYFCIICDVEHPVLHAEPNITPGLCNLISWDAVPEADEYYAECSSDPCFSTVDSNSGWIAETNYEFCGLASRETYWYRVKAGSTLAESDWSNTESSRQCGTPGDFEPDCDVDWADLALFTLHWLDTDCNDIAGDETDWCYGTDIDQDGNTVFHDFVIMANSWFEGVPKPLFYEDFNDGLPFDGWDYYSSDSNGRIQVVDGRLRMYSTAHNSYTLNEAVLHLDLEGRSNVVLAFFQAETVNGDEVDLLPDIFTGHYDGDGVSVSSDGVTWHQVVNANELDVGAGGQIFNVNLDDAGIAYTSDFRIKFQQYDNYSWPSDGREFDNIEATFSD